MSDSLDLMIRGEAGSAVAARSRGRVRSAAHPRLGPQCGPYGRQALIKALLIDIDDTLVRVQVSHQDGDFSCASLMDVVRRAGVELGGLSPAETDRRMEQIQREIRWWHWSDFILALELNPRTFWEYAYEIERQYLEPTGPEIHCALQRLHDAGLLLYVTSNNPSSGILHKLRLAGLGHINGAPLFSQLLGPPELQAMKWEPRYWKKVLAHIGMDAGEVAVIGDDLQCDWEVPHSIGINCAFLIDRAGDQPAAADAPGLFHVQSFEQIADRLLIPG